MSSQNDDYNNNSQIKPDNSSSPLPESVSHIDWVPMNMGNLFAVTFWDGTLRVYDVANNGYSASLVQKINAKAKAPLTKCVWSLDCQNIYVGDVTGLIQAFNVSTSSFVDIGKHNAAISALHIVPNQGIIISAAYENVINFWQPGNNQPVFSLDMGNKVFCTDFTNPLLLVCMNNEKIGIVDINNANQKTILDSVDLGKHSQIQSCAINRNGDTVGFSTFDGRSNIASITKSSSGLYTQSHKHQITSSQIILYPVNSVSFNHVSSIWFLTCGSDGAMSFWDFNIRNKIKSLTFGGSPICCAKVSPSGEMIAYGLGNDWHIGPEGSNKWQPRLGVHKLVEQEMKFPK